MKTGYETKKEKKSPTVRFLAHLRRRTQMGINGPTVLPMAGGLVGSLADITQIVVTYDDPLTFGEEKVMVFGYSCAPCRIGMASVWLMIVTSSDRIF